MPLARFPSESRPLFDDATGRRILQVTSHPQINHHLYFLTSSLTRAEDRVVFCSYRTGRPEFYRAGFPAGEITQLTDEPGIGGFSAVLGPGDQELIYTAAGAIRAVALEGSEARTIAAFPGAGLGECSLSPCGEWLVTALRDGEGAALAVARLDGSEARIILRPGRTIIHPQFHPTDSSRILYSQDPAPRMWMIRRDGAENTCLYEHGNDEFLVHETFLLPLGQAVIVVRWPYELLRLDLQSREFTTIAEINAWHIASSPEGRKVLCDTAHPDRGILLIDVATGEVETVCMPRSSCGGSQWRRDRYALAEDFAAARDQAGDGRALSWMEQKADTVYGPQWTHPHPSFSPSARWITYTSDCSGCPQVYAVELDGSPRPLGGADSGSRSKPGAARDP